MEDQDIILQINKIFSAILKKEVSLTPTTTAADVAGWDSLTHMMLIDTIEKHFAIKFKLMEIMKLNNIGDMVGFIKKKTAK
jgi:acyl carrier protein